MVSGSDIAKFLEQNLGDDFVGLYNQSKKYSQEKEVQMEQITRDFKQFVSRIETPY